MSGSGVRSPVTYCPRRGPCVRAFSLVVGIPLGGMAAATLLTGPLPDVPHLMAMLAALPIVAILFGFLMHHVVAQWPFTVDVDGISGVDGRFRPRRLAWADIGDVRTEASHGIPTMIAVDRDRGHDVTTSAVGLDRAALRAHLAATVGRDHPLSRAFAAD